MFGTQLWVRTILDDNLLNIFHEFGHIADYLPQEVGRKSCDCVDLCYSQDFWKDFYLLWV